MAQVVTVHFPSLCPLLGHSKTTQFRWPNPITKYLHKNKRNTTWVWVSNRQKSYSWHLKSTTLCSLKSLEWSCQEVIKRYLTFTIPLIWFFFIPALVIRLKRKLFTTHTWSQVTRCNPIWRSRCPLFWARQPTMPCDPKGSSELLMHGQVSKTAKHAHWVPAFKCFKMADDE